MSQERQHLLSLFTLLVIVLVLIRNAIGQRRSFSMRPHVVLIVADDLGWNDVSWNNPDIKMPNLERLARGGVILNQSYVQPVCSPSRTAFMTGYFPYHVGRQNSYIHRFQPSGVYLNYTFLPEKLKQLGYSTHVIGKWHLGYCNWSYTPTFRGFDSFFGFYLGAEEYYTHRSGYDGQNYLDLRNNTKPATEYGGVYSTNLFSTVTTKLISRLNPRIPTFLYLPFQAVHSPLEVPQKYLDMHKNIEDVNRRKYSGMISALDEAVGNITTALKKYGFYSNSVIGFTTDNGGQIQFGGNNWPLRGNKGTLWEGGTRGPAFVHSPLLNRKGFVTNNPFKLLQG
ncbi:arylsulfatase B-like [Limulus polyphemus]|uniref:Arylsulfatase B-like n=1 Tax=Limulus polyphemus TaxID=6850 RepID=A0ABM1SC16_LIMPO|nr:arylsulfatase B-like [Limulus polyphemus]